LSCQERAQRRGRIIDQLSIPDELPERVQQLAADEAVQGVIQIVIEAGPVLAQEAHGSGQIQRYAPIALTKCAAAQPDHLSGVTQLVEVATLVPRQTRR
jgi:hypothetical protein